MSAKILDGKALSAKIKEEIKEEVLSLAVKGIKPSLAVILVGDNLASQKYVSFKEKACRELGIESIVFRLPEETQGVELISLIKDLNHNSSINGILVQLPLPPHLSENIIIENINPLKDVDGFTPLCLGRLFVDNPLFVPCTPKGVLRMLDEYFIDIEGKNVVIVGRSKIVGKPLAMLFLRRNATVTICHSKTKDLKEITRSADILCVATGRAGLIKADMVQEEAVVIDIGINVTKEGKVVGDVDFDSIKEKASYITPVPGGVGPMTIAMLMENTIRAAKIQKGLEE
jgi:methylenetetrahydrofolate dehydrogenase (NADP+)/methenyltetrahydrofolate cyclohydrolase